MLQELQRGLGLGYLRARKADRQAAVDALMICIRDDPRWDRQLDQRGWYYGSLAVELGVDSAALPPPDAPNMIPILARMAGLKDEAALHVLRTYIGEGENWAWALSCLSCEGVDTTSFDAIVTARRKADGALEEPAAALKPRTHEKPPKRKPLGEMSVAELLAQDGVDNHRIVRQLVARASDDELVSAAREWSPLAIRAAGARGLAEVLELSGAVLDHTQPARGAVFLALTTLPFALTRDRAHAWMRSTEHMHRRLGASILAEYATHDDASAARSAMTAELALGAEADQYVICSLAQALGRASKPSVELREAFYGLDYSYGRRFVVRALLATEPDFERRFATEVRLDCEETVRELDDPRVA